MRKENISSREDLREYLESVLDAAGFSLEDGEFGELLVQTDCGNQRFKISIDEDYGYEDKDTDDG